MSRSMANTMTISRVFFHHILRFNLRESRVKVKASLERWSVLSTSSSILSPRSST